MLRRAAIVGALIVSVSCSKSEGGDVIGGAGPSAAGSATKSGSGGGGFSADLAKELGSASTGKTGSAPKAGSDAPRSGSDAAKAGSDVVAKAGGDTAKAGGDTAKAGGDTAKAGGDTAKAGGDTAKAGGDTAKAGGDTAKAGSNAVAMAGSAAQPASPPNAGSGAKAGSNTAATAGSAAQPAPVAPAGTPSGATSVASQAHGPVKVPADLAAIKLSLLPNWDRDIDQAGTFQYVVRIKGTQTTKTFVFHYGYEDPKAPADRDQYKKYLQDTRALSEVKDRQRGAAWFLEGSDASGLPAFRFLVLYGGKRLICYGSQYKDADSNRLGDDRDQTVIQAKQICETLAL